MNVNELVKDKRVWAVAGIGGVAGLVILLKGKGQATGQASTAAGYGVQTAATPGTYDSTSADVAAQLGQYQTGLQTALGQYSADQTQALLAYQQQLTDSLAGLTAGQPTTPTTPVVTTPEHGARYQIQKGDNWNTIAAKYGVSPTTLLSVNANDPSRGYALSVGDYIWLPKTSG